MWTTEAEILIKAKALMQPVTSGNACIVTGNTVSFSITNGGNLTADGSITDSGAAGTRRWPSAVRPAPSAPLRLCSSVAAARSTSTPARAYPVTLSSATPDTCTVSGNTVVAIAVGKAVSATRLSADPVSPALAGQTTTLSVRTQPNLSQPGESVPVSVRVTPAQNVGTLSGTVDVSSDGQSCRITLPETRCTLVFARKGVKALSATYSGNNFYSAASGSGRHLVGKLPDILLSLSVLLD